MLSHALTRGGPARFLAAAAAVIAFISASTPEATHHNARVAEYLLQQHQDAGTHNACVAEYLLHLGTSGR